MDQSRKAKAREDADKFDEPGNARDVDEGVWEMEEREGGGRVLLLMGKMGVGRRGSDRLLGRQRVGAGRAFCYNFFSFPLPPENFENRDRLSLLLGQMGTSGGLIGDRA